MSALSFFTAGSLIAALARNISMLIAGRCVQGIGAGGLMVTTWVVLARLFDLEQRSRFYSLVGLIWMVGTVIGPVVGGAFALASWRWIFWINLPLCTLSYVLVILFLRFETSKEYSVAEQLRKLDWVGQVLFAASMTLLLVALSWVSLDRHTRCARTDTWLGRSEILLDELWHLTAASSGSLRPIDVDPVFVQDL